MTHFQRKISFAIFSLVYAKMIFAGSTVITQTGKHYSKNGALIAEVFSRDNRNLKSSSRTSVQWPEEQGVWNLSSPELAIESKISIAGYKEIRMFQFDTRSKVAAAFTNDAGDRFVVPFEYNAYFSQDEESIEFSWGWKGESYIGKLARKKGSFGEAFVGYLVNENTEKSYASKLSLVEKKTVFKISPVQVIANLPTIAYDGDLFQARSDLTTSSTQITDLESNLFFISIMYYNYVDLHLNVEGGSYFYSKWPEWGVGAPCYHLRETDLLKGCYMRGEVRNVSDITVVNLSNPVGTIYNYHDQEYNVWMGSVTFIGMPQ